MRMFALLLFSLGFPAVQSWAAVPFSVTVLLDFEHSGQRVSLPMLQHQLATMFRSSGISVAVLAKNDLPANRAFGDLAVFKMKGTCTATMLPIAALSDERGPLAMTYTNDDEVLPFGEVECDRVRSSLRRVYGVSAPLNQRDAAFHVALARVIAHELYHMVAASKQHASSGVTKEALSTADLTGPALPFADEVKAELSSPSK